MNQILITTIINVPISKVWSYYTQPEFVTQWNFASPDWCCPSARSDFQIGGRFSSRMEAKDGSMGFDFGGVYTAIETNKLISYIMVEKDKEPSEADRKVTINFDSLSAQETKVTITFDPENTNSAEMQKAGWQSILDNFKKITEQN